MTLPSLCSAIRSQLYFSQISAWCDLIKKSDKNIYDTGRFIFTTPPTTSAAGDLATTTTGNVLSTSPSGAATTTNSANTSSSSSHSSSGVGGNSTNRKAPRLNIFYRIKTYDNNSACFNSKPNVHNFPNVNVSENCSVSVCLKSLPRISGGIPKVGPVSAATANTSTIVAAATTTESSTTTSAHTLQGTHATTTTTRATAAGSWIMTSVPKGAISASTNAAGTTNTNKPITKFLTMNCDNKDSKEYHQKQQEQQQTAVFNANYLNRGNSHPHDNDEIANKDGARHDFPTNVRSQALGKLTEEGVGFGGSVGDDDSFNGDFESCGAVAYNCDHAGGSGGSGGVDGDSSNSSFSTNFGNLSHREKQLLKYRKRMLKRDKKHQQQRKTNDGNVTSQANDQAQKMEQGEDDDDEDDDDREEDQNEMATMSSRSKENETDVKNTTTKGQRQQQLPNSFINSIPSTHGRQQQQEQQQHVKMISTGTQTTITNNASTTCSSCGFEKSMICLKCNPLRSPNAAASIIDDYKFDHEDGMDVQESPTMSSGSVSSTSSSSACSLSSSDIIHTPRNKAELLLQAIQRTPKSNKKLKITKDLQHHHKEQHITTTKKQTLTASATQSTKVNNNNGSHSRTSPSNTSISSSSSSSSSSLNGSSIIQIQSCQVCKRQKTQHNFQQPTTSLEATSPEDCSPTAETKSSCTSSSLVICSSSQSNGNQSDDVLGESENETDGGKMSTTEDCIDNVPIVNTAANCSGKESCDIKTTSDIFKAHEVMEEVSKLLELHLINLFIKGVGGIT